MDSSSSRLPGWAELDEALDAALDLEEPERAAYVASLEASLRRALVPLLQAALTVDPVLDHPEVVLESLVMPPDGMEAGDAGDPVEPDQAMRWVESAGCLRRGYLGQEETGAGQSSRGVLRLGGGGQRKTAAPGGGGLIRRYAR